MSENQMIRSNDEMEIDLVEIFYLLWNNILKILLCLVISAVVAFAYSYFMITPLYKATSKMYINTSAKAVVDISDLQISAQLRGDYKALMTSRDLLESVVRNLNLKYSAKDLGRRITIENPADTRIITITMTSSDPVEAADVANELANRAKEKLPEIMRSEEPVIYEKAIVPTSKSSPSYTRNTMIGGLLGAIVCGGYLIVKYLMNDTIVTPDDALKYLGIQPLAVIPEGDLGNFNKKKKAKSKTKKGKKTK